MWRGLVLTKAARAVPQGRPVGRRSTTCSSTCRRAPATSRWASPACSRRPRCSSSPHPRWRRRRSPSRVADMARRSYMKVVGVVENMSEFVAPDGTRFAVFGEGGGDGAGATRSARRWSPASRSSPSRRGRRRRRARGARPTGGPAGSAFHAWRPGIVDGADPPGRDGRLHRSHARPPRTSRALAVHAFGTRRHGHASDQTDFADAPATLSLALELDQVGVHLPAGRVDQLGWQIVGPCRWRPRCRGLRRLPPSPA